MCDSKCDSKCVGEAACLLQAVKQLDQLLLLNAPGAVSLRFLDCLPQLPQRCTARTHHLILSQCARRCMSIWQRLAACSHCAACCRSDSKTCSRLAKAAGNQMMTCMLGMLAVCSQALRQIISNGINVPALLHPAEETSNRTCQVHQN